MSDLTADQSASPRVVRDGKVAVLYSPGFGSGWYTWNTEHPDCLFSPEIVELLETDRRHAILDKARELWGQGFYCGSNIDGLEIAWIPEGEDFKVDDYDGSESIVLKSDSEIWIRA
jgi:hypothetical protein